jgi:hypothetical protein
VLGTSIRVFQEYSEKQRPAQHLHRLFIVPKGHHCVEAIGSQATKGTEWEIRRLILKTLQLLVYDFG